MIPLPLLSQRNYEPEIHIFESSNQPIKTKENKRTVRSENKKMDKIIKSVWKIKDQLNIVEKNELMQKISEALD